MRSLLTASLLVAVLTQPPPGSFPKTMTIDGLLTFADYERHIEHPFDVPPGARRIDVALAFTGVERRTVIDLGLRDPDGLRGWSGGRTNHVAVSRLSATPGYLPGSIPAGRWAVLIGVPNIRSDSHDSYRIVVTIGAEESGDEGPVVVREGPGWFVGDLHAHSFHSDGRGRSQAGKAVPVPVHRVLDEASRAGLDFVAVSDHNTASHWLDIDRLQPYYDRLLLLHGREITTYRGHANALGERAFTDFRLASPTTSPASVLHPIADAGAFISINHPMMPDDERCMGCGWSALDGVMKQAVQGVEVVNGTAREGPLFGWPFWADLLNRGWRVTAVAGSDDHTPDDEADNGVGTPATVVWAHELSEPAIVEGLKSGRVYVRTRGPAGPRLQFEAVAGAARYPMGAVIRSPSAVELELRAELAGADGQKLQWIQNGKPLIDEIVKSGVHTRRVTARPGDWFSLVVHAADGPTLLSNAVLVR